MVGRDLVLYWSATRESRNKKRGQLFSNAIPNLPYTVYLWYLHSGMDVDNRLHFNTFLCFFKLENYCCLTFQSFRKLGEKLLSSDKCDARGVKNIKKRAC